MHASLKSTSILVRLISLLMFALPAAAHPDASHGHGGFIAGLLHPLTGMDHLLAMLAVGIWAAQSASKMRWILLLTFPVAMIFGALIGAFGVPLLGVEWFIALSVTVLGVFVAFAVQLPITLGASLISFFAIFHGYAHAAEMPTGGSIMAYGAGFVLATVALHFFGLSFCLMQKAKFGLAVLAKQNPNSLIANRFSGIGIASAGVFYLFG